MLPEQDPTVLFSELYDEDGDVFFSGLDPEYNFKSDVEEPTLSFPDQGLTLLNGSPTKWPNLGIIYKINGKWITRNKKDKTRTRKTGCR